MKFFIKYQEYTTLRTFIKAIPYAGEPFDFWLSKKSESARIIFKQKELKDLIQLTNNISDKVATTSFIGTNLKVKTVPSFLPPQIKKSGEYQLNENEKAKSRELGTLLISEQKPNDNCGAVFNLPHWGDDPLYIEYVHLSYSDIKSVRENKTTYMLSGNGVLFSQEKRLMLIHRRSKKSDDYPNKLHSFGGGFIPPEVEKLSDYKINETVRREILEETGISANIPQNTPIIVIDEFALQFLQVTFLGINITDAQILDKRENWEGDIVSIHFDKLEERMQIFDDWTPSGWIHIIYWLALNCPGTNNEIFFKGKTGKQLADKLLNDLIEFEKRH